MHPERFPNPRRTPGKRIGIAVGSGVLLLMLLVLWVTKTLVASNLLERFTFAQRGKAKVDITSIENALVEYSYANGGRYPNTLRELVVPDRNGHTYIKGTDIPRDPWGNEYRYDPPGPDGGRPTVYSLGKDGRRGGEGDDADIDNLSLREDR